MKSRTKKASFLNGVFLGLVIVASVFSLQSLSLGSIPQDPVLGLCPETTGPDPGCVEAGKICFASDNSGRRGVCTWQACPNCFEFHCFCWQ